MTAVIVALLTIPLAALRPYQQPKAPARDEFPKSFKVTIGAAAAPVQIVSPSTSVAGASTAGTAAGAAASAAKPLTAQSLMASRWSCEKYPMGTDLHGTWSHVSEHTGDAPERWDLLFSESGHCTEAAVIGKILFSPDERRIAQLSPDGFARFRERTSTFDRAVSVTPVGDGSLNYTAFFNGQPAQFDGAMQAWLEQLLPNLLREIPLNVPARVARYRERGGVPAVLTMIGEIRSMGARREHYLELLKSGPISTGDAELVASQAARDLAGSSSNLSSVIQKLPRSALQSAGLRQSLVSALGNIKSSGDRATTLEILAPNADPELLVLLAQAAEELPSSGDKANYLIVTAAEYLNSGTDKLRTAFFHAARTVQSSGDLANVLQNAMAYGHADPAVTMQIIDASRSLTSSGDAANVLMMLTSSRLLQTNTQRATIAAIQRTMTMASSGDRANVLTLIATAGLVSNADVRDAFMKATLALPSDGDRANVLAAAARQ